MGKGNEEVTVTPQVPAQGGRPKRKGRAAQKITPVQRAPRSHKQPRPPKPSRTQRVVSAPQKEEVSPSTRAQAAASAATVAAPPGSEDKPEPVCRADAHIDSVLELRIKKSESRARQFEAHIIKRLDDYMNALNMTLVEKFDRYYRSRVDSDLCQFNEALRAKAAYPLKGESQHREAYQAGANAVTEYMAGFMEELEFGESSSDDSTIRGSPVSSFAASRSVALPYRSPVPAPSPATAETVSTWRISSSSGGTSSGTDSWTPSSGAETSDQLG